MAAESLQSQEVTLDERWQSFLALHSLVKIVHDLDSRRREEMQYLLAELRLHDYQAPEGSVIHVAPFGKSREIPLVVEVADRDGDWHSLDYESEEYDAVVGAYSTYDYYFAGSTIEMDPENGGAYVYRDDGMARAPLTHETRFDLYPAPGSDDL